MESRRESQFQDECRLETLIADRIPLKQNVDIWYGTRGDKKKRAQLSKEPTHLGYADKEAGRMG